MKRNNFFPQKNTQTTNFISNLAFPTFLLSGPRCWAATRAPKDCVRKRGEKREFVVHMMKLFLMLGWNAHLRRKLCFAQICALLSWSIFSRRRFNEDEANFFTRVVKMSTVFTRSDWNCFDTVHKTEPHVHFKTFLFIFERKRFKNFPSWFVTCKRFSKFHRIRPTADPLGSKFNCHDKMCFLRQISVEFTAWSSSSIFYYERQDIPLEESFGRCLWKRPWHTYASGTEDQRQFLTKF
jgi:hypothetical protein